MTLAGSDSVEFAYANGATTTIAVDSGGMLNANSTNFYADNATYSTNQILVQGDTGGGHLKAAGSTFSLNQVYLYNGSVLNAGDLSGNTFNVAALPALRRRAVSVRHRQHQRQLQRGRHRGRQHRLGQTLALGGHRLRLADLVPLHLHGQLLRPVRRIARRRSRTSPSSSTPA